MTSRTNVHATGLVLGRTGLMLRGPSGAGKSLLALSLLDEWALRGTTAKLVADDRLDLAVEAGRLIMFPPPQIEGLIELRGRGIVQRPFATRAQVHLVIDLVDRLERMVEEEALEVEIEGVRLARCPVPRCGIVEVQHQLLLVREAVRGLSTANRLPRKKST